MGDALFLGVDGGGTKTCFVVIAADGTERARHTAATAYHLQIGVDGLRARLEEGVARVLRDAGAERAAVTHAFFGLPAYGEDNRIERALDAMPRSILGHDRYGVGNDMICGWAGGLAGADGIGIVAGTGSIGYGERRGRAVRAGGWGELFSDEGSAHWIARRMLNLFSRQSDGRLPRGPLYDIVRAHFDLADDLDLCGAVLTGDAAARDRIAALSPLAREAADRGDAAAIALFDQAVDELVAIAEAIRRPLEYARGEPVPLSYSGGVFRAGERVLARFAERLAAAWPDYRLQAPIHDPAVGAALYAQRLAAAACRNDRPAPIAAMR